MDFGALGGKNVYYGLCDPYVCGKLALRENYKNEREKQAYDKLNDFNFQNIYLVSMYCLWIK